MVRPPLALALALAAFCLPFAPTALAAPACAAEQSDAPAYVVLTGASFAVHREDNGVAGLQTAACFDADGAHHAADGRVASVPPPVPRDLCVWIPILNVIVCVL